jgi:two-component system alkaline phosphatase synthesis response regulator PhoP
VHCIARILPFVTSLNSHETLSAGSLEVAPHAYTARADGRVVPLTPREFELLVELMRRPHEVLSRELLYERCWGQPMTTSDRAVDVYVRKLRAKLDHAAPAWRFIHTHYRLGYRFSPEPAEELEPAEDARFAGDGARRVL